MNVALIYPPHPYLKQPDSQMPLGLLYLAAVLREKGIPVSVNNFSSFSDEDAIDVLPYADLYGITATSLDLPLVNQFAKKIKTARPYSKIILGGPCTITPNYIDFTVIDSICVGEGELVIEQMVKEAANDRLKICYHGPIVEELDSLPSPARDLLDYQGGNIFAYNRTYFGSGSTVIMTSRGCPFKCSFCSSPKLWRNVRYRSVESVIEEMKQVISDYGIMQFRFSDDLITAKRKRLFKLCREIEKLGIAWRASIRVKPFDEDMCKAMVDSGCKEVSPGIESFDNDVLKILNKKTTAADNARFLDLAYKCGLKTRMLMMVETPGQTENTVPENIVWLENVPYDMVAVKRFIPIPGSEIWDNPQKFNIEIVNDDLSKYNFYFFGPTGMVDRPQLIRIKGRDYKTVEAETTAFLEYLNTTGRLNVG